MNQYKIINKGKMLLDNKLITFYDIMCCNCKRVQRVSDLNWKMACTCNRRRQSDWKIVKQVDKYTSYEQFLSKVRFKYLERIYVKNPNIKITSKNIFKGTYKKYLKYRNKLNNMSAEKDTYVCKNCGKINHKEIKQCTICGAIRYKKGNWQKELSDHKYEKEYIDDIWETNIIPSMMNISNKSLSKSLTKDFTNYYASYFLKNNNLHRMGLFKMNVLDADFFIGNYKYYINKKGYVQYKNVFNNYKYEFEPIIYYICNNDKILSKYTTINSEQMDKLFFMYFEKEKNAFTFYRYENDKLKRRITSISNIIRKDSDGFLIEYKDKSREYYSFTNDELFETGDMQDGSKQIFNYTDFNTNIYLNIEVKNTLVDNTVINYLNTIHRIDNNKCKKIYVKRSEKLSNKVLFNYLENNFELNKIDNELEDDSSEIYEVIINKRNKKAISYIEFLSEIKKADNLKYRIYDRKIHDIISTLFSDYNFKNKLCDMIEQNIIIIENNKLKQNYTRIIYDHYYSTDNINIQICERLKTKYDVDNLGLFLIMLYKYGAENVLSIPCIQNIKSEKIKEGTTSVQYLCDSNENQEQYNNDISKINIDEVKWKSEMTLYKLIKSYFKEAKYQYRDKFLGNQSLDIFIPNLKIAFEYQGQQHYRAIEHFGGEEHFIKQQTNDRKKKELCQKNNIELIEWRYDEKIDKITLDKKLAPYRTIVNDQYTFSDFE